MIRRPSGELRRPTASLGALGYGRPELDQVRVDVGYVTRCYRLPPDALDGDLACLHGPTSERPRGGALARLEGETWMLTLFGLLGDHPPKDRDQRRLLRPLHVQRGARRARARRPAACPAPTTRRPAPDRTGLEAFIRNYLSPQHRDQPADGCPSAALLDEIARRPAATRQAFTDELLATADEIAARLDPTDAEAAQTDALTINGFMIGTPQLARALLTDPNLSDQLLTRGAEAALKLLDDRA